MPRLEGQSSKPRSFDKINITKEQRAWLEGESLDIFTECANAGIPFREALMAIFISGINLGIQLANGK